MNRGVLIGVLAVSALSGGGPSARGVIASPSPQARIGEPPLPQPEIFVARAGLRLSLRTPTQSLTLGERLLLTLRFHNQGTEPLYIVPRHPSPVFSSRSQLAVRPAQEYRDAAESRRLPTVITPDKLVSLAPGETWDLPLDSADLRAPLRLPPGEYTARVDYINYPDYDWVHYDPYTMPAGIWEGLLTADPVRFTVAPAPDADVAGYVNRLKSDDPDDAALEVLALSGSDGATALIERIPLSSRSRGRILLALRRAEPLPAAEFIKALDRLPPHERMSLLASTEFLVLVQQKADCALLAYLTDNLDDLSSVTYQFRPLFEGSASRCPGMHDLLRRVVLDPARSPTGRGNAAALLGVIRDPAETPLLIDILERGPATAPHLSGHSVEAIHKGAAAGLGLIGGRDALAALGRALANDRRNSRISSALARALFDIGGPEAIPPLIGALSSSDPNLVIQTIGWLRELKASAAVPRLIALLRHRNPTIRAYAAGALKALGDPAAHDAMIAALDDVDENVQTSVTFYLAERGDGSTRDRFIRGLESRRQGIREAAIAGIRRFGTERDFSSVRRLFDLSGRPDVHGYLPYALSSLTFVSDRNRRGPEAWDAWYAQHRNSTRIEWAGEALRRTDEEPPRWPFSASPQREASVYLAERGDARFAADLERAAFTRRFAVRIEAARALAAFDEPKAVRLLMREFTGRFFGACDAANRVLNELTGQTRTVDCRDPGARSRAAADRGRP